MYIYSLLRAVVGVVGAVGRGVEAREHLRHILHHSEWLYMIIYMYIYM